MPQPVERGQGEPALDETLRRAQVAMAATGLVFALATAGFGGLGAGAGVLIGTLVAMGNLWAFAFIVRALFGRGRPWGWALLGVLKMFGLFGVVAWLLREEIVRVIPFALGYASLPIGLTLSALFPPPSDNPPATDA
jgi:hypothetical protein